MVCVLNVLRHQGLELFALRFDFLELNIPEDLFYCVLLESVQSGLHNFDFHLEVVIDLLQLSFMPIMSRLLDRITDKQVCLAGHWPDVGRMRGGTETRRTCELQAILTVWSVELDTHTSLDLVLLDQLLAFTE